MSVRIIAYTVAYHVGLPAVVLATEPTAQRHNGTTAQRNNGTTVSGPAAGGVTENLT